MKKLILGLSILTLMGLSANSLALTQTSAVASKSVFVKLIDDNGATQSQDQNNNGNGNSDQSDSNNGSSDQSNDSNDNSDGDSSDSDADYQ